MAIDYINVWVAIPNTRLLAWDGTEEAPSHKPKDQSPRNLFRKDISGGKEWTMRNVYVEEVDGWQGILLGGYPTTRLLGAWRKDGELATEEVHDRILEFLPDNVTYDEDGNEVSRSRPIAFTDVNLGMGWEPRELIARPIIEVTI